MPPSLHPSLVQMQECQKLRWNELPGHRANQSRATTIRVHAMSMIYDCHADLDHLIEVLFIRFLLSAVKLISVSLFPF